MYSARLSFISRNFLTYDSNILGVDGRIILKWICKGLDGGGGGMNWIDLAQDRDRWWALVNTVMNLQVP
jgi:hypothetical protein